MGLALLVVALVLMIARRPTSAELIFIFMSLRAMPDSRSEIKFFPRTCPRATLFGRE
jgi:hypothetical protein